MFNLGVAVSIAKKPLYSWEYTIDFCTTNRLSLIQFYWQYPLPLIKRSEALRLQNRYLHLPGNLKMIESLPDFSLAYRGFNKYYESNKLIIHQQGDGGSVHDDSLIRQLNTLNCLVGFENHHSESLNGYTSSLYAWHQKQYRIFVVFDVHKFFNRFYRKYSVKEILQAIRRLFLCCRELNLTLLLHIIDSKSFQANEAQWCPVFEGIVPYEEIFDLLLNKPVKCEGLILEYQDEIMALESINRLHRD